MLLPVILCGGSGTRLWPLSRKAFPKQFVPLIDNKSLLALTLERAAPIGGGDSGVLLVGAEEHRFLLREALESAELDGKVLLEPVARNTAAAMALAALASPASEALLLFCPCDHHIPDVAAFSEMVRSGIALAEEGDIVTFGVVPSFPSTGYGYIERGERRSCGFAVKRFIEKPNATRAQELLLGGEALWNAGIFLCRADTLLAAMELHAPDILAQCRESMAAATYDGAFTRPARKPLDACRSESIDFAVMEKHRQVAVIPFAGLWSDVGSWNAVADMCPPDTAGNRIEGNGVALDGSNNFIHAPTRTVVALGTDDLIIVDTPDAVLVARRGSAEQVKSVVTELERLGGREAVDHRLVQRPWGSYDSIERGQRFQVKRIIVKPGASLSLQKHYHRSEHWVVVSGTAEVTKGEEVFLLSENQSTYIPAGEVHRLRNPGRTPLEMIEVQSGSYLGEDDILRMDDSYGRVVQLADVKKTA